MASKNLTHKQALFILEYLIDSNATQAAIRAGYSKKTAMEQGHQLLHKTSVSEAIEKSRAKRAAKLELKGEDVLRKIIEVGKLCSDPDSKHWNPNAALKALFYQGRELGMNFATERQEIASHGDIAEDIYEGRKRAAERRRPGAGKRSSA